MQSSPQQSIHRPKAIAPDSPSRLHHEAIQVPSHEKHIRIMPSDTSQTVSCTSSGGWTSPTSSRSGSSSDSHEYSNDGIAAFLPPAIISEVAAAPTTICHGSKSSHRSAATSKAEENQVLPSSAADAGARSEAVSELHNASASSLLSTATTASKKEKKSKKKKSKEKPKEIEITFLAATNEKKKSISLRKKAKKDEDLQLLQASSSTFDTLDDSNSNDDDSNASAKLRNQDFHRLIRKQKWRRLAKATDYLLRVGSDYDHRSALTKCNKYGESTLHVAAWNVPSAIFTTMLQLVPENEASDFLLEVDNNGNTVLHFACASLEHQEDFAVVRKVANMAPEALDVQNREGDTPLHALVSSKGFQRCSDFVLEAMAEEIITLLLEVKKSSELLLNNEGANLLHVAVACEAHERVLMRLIQLDPESVKQADEQGMLPIHYLAAFGGTLPWTVAQECIRLLPECVHHRTSSGDTPLHLLVQHATNYLNEMGVLHRNTTKLAELLIGSSRSREMPLLAQNSRKLTPLHIAAVRNTPTQLTRLLLSVPGGEYATAVSAEFEATPIHLLCAAPDVSERLDTLEILATSKACCMFDSIGRTPLVIAVQNETASKELISHLLEVYPRAATMPCRAGNLPVHLAVQKQNIDVSIVKQLLAVHPKIARAVNASRNTPLHEAAIHGAPAPVIALLLEKYPDAIQEQNKKGQRPLNCARERKAPTDVLDLLDETTMSLTSTLHPIQLSFSSSPLVPGRSMAEF
ncbi:hypothetical protein MPSEU_000810300 [Mayamaea pseudoterrestris]|nr:hypothetical protein MPSEU_000810300 [Mayamaea pseudoterrestris]